MSLRVHGAGAGIPSSQCERLFWTGQRGLAGWDALRGRDRADRRRDVRHVASADGEDTAHGRFPAPCPGRLSHVVARNPPLSRTEDMALGTERDPPQPWRTAFPLWRGGGHAASELLRNGSKPRARQARPGLKSTMAGSARCEDVPLPRVGAPSDEAGTQRLMKGPPAPLSWRRSGGDRAPGPRGPWCRGPASRRSRRRGRRSRGKEHGFL